MRQIRIMRMRKIDLRRFFTYRLCKESIFKCSGYILYVHIEIFLYNTFPESLCYFPYYFLYIIKRAHYFTSKSDQYLHANAIAYRSCLGGRWSFDG